MYAVYVSSPSQSIQRQNRQQRKNCRYQPPADMFGTFLSRDPRPSSLAYTPWYVHWDDHSVQLKTPARTGDRRWQYKLSADGFKAEDIKLTVDSQKVTVTGRREKRGAGFVDRREIQRTIVVPDEVNALRLSCTMTDDGNIVLKAPVNDTIRGRVNQEKCDQPSPCPHRNNDDKQGKMMANEESESDKDIATKINEKCGRNTSERNDDSKYTSSTTGTSDNAESAEIMAEIDKQRPPSPFSAPSIDADDNRSYDSFEIVERSETSTEKIDTEYEVKDTSTFGNVENSAGDRPKHTAEPSTSVDESRIVEEDGHEMYQVNVNLDGFKPEDVSIKCRGDILSIDAVNDHADGGVYRLQEIHRQFSLPKMGQYDAATAAINGSGQLRISVPLEGTNEREIPTSRDGREE